MLTNLHLENFRAFEEVSIDFSKINLFFGPNNSGKSSFISALTVLSQTLQSPDSEIPILLNGKYEDLGTYYDMVFSNIGSKHIKFGIQGKFVTTDRTIVSGVGRKSPYLRTQERALHNYCLDVYFAYLKQRHEIVLEKTEIKTTKNEILISTKRSKRLGIHRVDSISDSLSVVKRNLEPIMMNFIPFYKRTYGYRKGEKGVYDFKDIASYTSMLRDFLASIEFVGPFRAPPERSYSYTGENPSSVGKFGNKAIEILVSDTKRRGKLKKGLINQLSSWLADAKIARGIQLYSISDRHYEIMVENIDTGEAENLADAGFGCSQILPILVAGLNCEPGSLLIIQQPEIHLHPKAQAELGSFLYMVAKKGVQLIVETHSEHLLLRLQSHIAAGDLGLEDICVYCTDYDQNNNNKILRNLPIGEDGIFTKEWPRGFFPERLEEAKRLAKLSLR